MVINLRNKTIKPTLTGLALFFAASSVFANSLDEQRIRYKAIQQALKSKNISEVERLLPTLTKYPLYPYLEYRKLTQDVSKLNNIQVNDYITKYPEIPISKTLRNTYLTVLAKREAWSDYLNYAVQPPSGVKQQCNYAYAQYASGNKSGAFEATTKLWHETLSLPTECDKLVSAWRASNQQTPESILQRINLTSNAGTKDSRVQAEYLVKMLAGQNKVLGEDAIKAYTDPDSLLAFSQKYSPSPYTQDVVQNALAGLGRKNALTALNQIPQLVSAQKMSAAQKKSLEETLSGQLINNDVSANLAKWRDGIIAQSQNTNLVERRIRLALGNNDIQTLNLWLNALPPEAQKKEEWLYWKADRLLAEGKKKEGEDLLTQLSATRGFYPMVAAQRLNKPYVVRAIKSASINHENFDSLEEVKRIKELIYWQQDNNVRSEWLALLSEKSPAQLESFARYAYEQKWANLSVQATISGKLWDHLEERFPVAYPNLFKNSVKDKQISETFAMAIARQESAWNTQANSSAGARGLMQLMPQTAKETAKALKMTDYKNSSQLFEPATNIKLGTQYLNYTYERFNNNRILAAAAYNAGPHRVTTWLNRSNGTLDAIAFIESIPFNETRGYVKNVLSYDVFYHYFANNKKSNVLTNDEWKRIY